MVWSLVIAEDADAVRNGLCKGIDWESLGFRLAGAFGDGKSAADFLREHPADVVLTDIRMPGLDGLDLAQYVKRRNPPTCVILLSAYGEFDLAQRAIELGVERYLLKPVRAQELRKVFAELAEKLRDGGEAGTPDGAVEAALAYIHAHYAEDITLSDVARAAFVSKNYLSTVFKREVGTGFSCYLNHLRVQKAIALLNSGRSIGEIAALTGFSDTQYMARVFRQETGLSPTEYRKKEAGQ